MYPFMSWLPALALAVFSSNALSQERQTAPSPLFGSQEPLALSIRASIRELKGETNDSTYLHATLYYGPRESASDSVAIRMRARGHARRDICFYPPLALRFSEGDVRGTPFEGQKEVKLVMPCQAGAPYEDLVLRELLAYRLFEQVSPFIIRRARFSSNLPRCAATASGSASTGLSSSKTTARWQTG